MRGGSSISVSVISSRVVGGAFRSCFFLRATHLIRMLLFGSGEAEEGGGFDGIGG